MMTNYIGFMAMCIMILSTLVIFLIWGCISLYRINRAERKAIRCLKTRVDCDERHNYDLYLDCQTLLTLLYDVVLSNDVDMAYKATVIRSSLALLGLKHGSQYEVGTLQSVIETPDIDQINTLVTDIINTVSSYGPGDIVFEDPSILTALERFNLVMDRCHAESTRRKQEKMDDAAMDMVSDPVYDQVSRDVHTILSQRAQAIIA